MALGDRCATRPVMYPEEVWDWLRAHNPTETPPAWVRAEMVYHSMMAVWGNPPMTVAQIRRFHEERDAEHGNYLDMPL